MDEKLICFNEDEILKPREIIIEIMNHMIDKDLTDFSGGNMALRVGKRIYVTQSYAATKYRWKLRPDDIIVTDIDKNVMEGRKEKISREGDLHYGVLKRFPEINCTIHGNAFYTPLLSSLGITVKGTTETAQYYNIVEIPSIPEGIEPLSDEENNAIFSELEKLKAKDQTLAVIMPYHGLIVGGKDADETFAIFEAIEKNSQFVIQREMLKGIIGQNSFSQENNLNQSRSFRSTGKNMISQTNDLDNKSKVLTSEDIVNYIKITDMKEIKVNSGCIITSQAESKAQELGIRIIKG